MVEFLCGVCTMGSTQEDVVKISQWMESRLALIPPSYLAPPDSEAIEMQYMKKTQKAELKMERKKRYLDRKRDLLDPKKTAHRVVDLGGSGIESVGLASGSGRAEMGDGNAEEENGGVEGFQGLGKGLWSENAVSKEGLKGNLQEKLEGMKAARMGSGVGRGKKRVKRGMKENEDEGGEKAVKGKSGKGKKKVKRGVKENEDEGGEKAVKGKLETGKKRGKRKMVDVVDEEDAGDVVGGASTKNGKKNQQVEENGSKEGIRVQFGAIEGMKKKKKREKKDKQDQLREAEAKVEKLKKFASSGEGGEEVMEEAWKTALDRAEGERVLDNPKLLRKNINRERKKKVKSTKQWQERIKTVEAKMAKRQNRAKANLKARTDKKMERRKMKRLKKLVS